MRACPSCSREFPNAAQFCPHDGSRLEPPDPVGLVVDGKYRIDRLLGAGGMASVYRAVQLQLERPVAVKLIRGDFSSGSRTAERFKLEALTVARLKHPNIVTIHDFGVDPTAGAFIVMELLEGSSLREEIRRRRRFPAAETRWVARQICAALGVAHAAGVVHRDLKPDNIFLESGSGGQVVKVLDFGIAKLVDLPSADTANPITAEGIAMGTPAYMSPEQCQGEPLDARSDLYALGCVLYEMLSGRPPFVAETGGDLMRKHVTLQPDPLLERVPDLAPMLAGIVARALAKRPADRFQSAAELAEALEDVSTTTGAAGAGASYDAVTVADAAVVTPGAAETTPSNLTPRITTFVGRTSEIAEIRGLLDTTRVVTLVGPGGIGKSRLGVEAAGASLASFGGGVWHVDLSALEEPSLVAHTVATVLGVRETPGVAVETALAATLGSRRALLLLDGCEHVVASCAALVSALVRSCPNIVLLAASREPLGVEGEAVFRVGPLGADLDGDAVRLFLARARSASVRVEIDEAAREKIAALCIRVDGIPLAIELAAARARVLSLEQILARLDDRFRLLSGGSRTALARQQTLRATVDWSYDLLDEKERDLLRRLSVFAGGFDYEAVEAVAAVESVAGALDDAALDLLTRLVDKSLVVAEIGIGEARYRMLDTIRDYASEKLTETGSTDAVRRGHRDYFLSLAERAEPQLKGNDEARWLARLDLEHDNLRAAIRWSAETGDGASQLRFAAALGLFWTIRGHWFEGRKNLAEALAAGGLDLPEARAKVLSLAGSLAMKQGDDLGAERLYEESLGIRRRIGDRQGVAHTLHNLGILLRRRGDLNGAARNYEESHEIYRGLGNPRNLAISLTSLGSLAFDRGDYARARQAIEESITILTAVGHRSALGASQLALGEVLLHMGEVDAARTRFDASLEIARELGYSDLEASSLCQLGEAALASNDLATARRRFSEALEAYRALGHKAGMAEAREGLARVAATTSPEV